MKGLLRNLIGAAQGGKPIATVLQVDMGSPAPGFAWEVFNVVLFDMTTGFTFAACNPWIATGFIPVAASMYRDIDKRGTPGTPWSQTYGGVIVVSNPDRLIVGAQGVGTHDYVVACQVLEHRALEFAE